MSNQDDNRERASIAQQIENQLAEGRRLLELQLQTRKDLERAAARRSIWVENNVRLLKDSALADHLKTKLLAQASLDDTDTGEDFAAAVDSFRDITRAQMSVLASALTLTDKPQDARQVIEKENAAPAPRRPELTTVNPRSDLSFKEKLERNPIGFAAIVCVASISITVLLMGWYQDKTEKALTTKYDIQLISMKNELEAQKREYEETKREYEATIRKLRDDLAASRVPGKRQEYR